MWPDVFSYFIVTRRQGKCLRLSHCGVADRDRRAVPVREVGRTDRARDRRNSTIAPTINPNPNPNQNAGAGAVRAVRALPPPHRMMTAPVIVIVVVAAAIGNTSAGNRKRINTNTNPNTNTSANQNRNLTTLKPAPLSALRRLLPLQRRHRHRQP